MQIGVTMFATDYAMRRMNSPSRRKSAASNRSGSPSTAKFDQPQVAMAGRSRAAEVYYDPPTTPSLPSLPPPSSPRPSSSAPASVWWCSAIPVHTAKEVPRRPAVHGRLLFGVGGGWNAEEMADPGTAFGTRFKLMGERVER